MNNDPRMTAYALNELSATEKKQFRDELLKQGMTEQEIQTEVNSIIQTADVIKEEYAKDQEISLPIEKKQALNQLEEESFFSKWKKTIYWGSGITAPIILSILIFKPFQPNRIQELVFEPRIDTLSQTSKPKDKEQSPSTSVADTSLQSNSYDLDAKSGKAVAISKTNRPARPSKKKIVSQGGGAHSSGELRRNKGFSTGKLSGGKRGRVSRAEGFALSDAVSSEVVERRYPSPGIIAPPQVPAEKSNREAYDKIDTNKYTQVSNQPLSTLSIDVDTASYTNMRRFLMQGQLPPKDSIRVEELINYFPYNYNMDFSQHPVAVKADVSNSPWNKDRKLVRVALESAKPKNLLEASKNLVFLIDVSGSMNSPKKLPLLKESMKLLARKLKKKDKISIVTYAGSAGIILNATPVSENLKVIRAIDQLGAGGSTNGAAGIKTAYQLAKQNFMKNGVNRIILATDGDFNVGTTSQSSLIDLVESKAKEDIFLTVVGLGMGNYQDSLLEKLSNRGNGNYSYIDSIGEANKLFNVDLEKNLTTVAKDVKIQVEFNPHKVQAYRLIGYENRKLAAQDFNDDKKDAGEMGAGHTVTALYEIVPVGVKMDKTPKIDKLKYSKTTEKLKSASDSNELLTVKVRYKQPTGAKSTKIQTVLKENKSEFKQMDDNFRFATAVATFGMKLRGDNIVDGMTYRDLEKMAKESKGQDSYNFREELVELINLARQVDK
ncbi:VWA domain-containing protein [Bacteriovoracaceae bacterium]|nr:VWA domain-containing protein [Bacteriovoracaceae bacterium]